MLIENPPDENWEGEMSDEHEERMITWASKNPVDISRFQSDPDPASGEFDEEFGE